MQKQITEEDIEFLDCLADPTCATEIIFSDLDQLGKFDQEKFANVRLHQIPMQSFEYLVRDDFPEEEKYRLMEEAGSLHAYGARNYGKSLISLIADECLSMIHHIGWEMGFSSYDEPHIYGIQDKVYKAMSLNPFLKFFFKKRDQRNNYLLIGRDGTLIESINMKLKSSRKDNAGEAFFQKHHKKSWTEEKSFETSAVEQKRADSKDLKVYVERASGMTNFTKHTPAGKIFYNPKLKHLLVNLPQFCNKDFTKQKLEEAILKHHGKHSVGFRIFVLGTVVEEGEAALDMERVRKCYLSIDKEVRFIEIPRDDYVRYGGELEFLLPVSRPKWAERIWIAGDIGGGAPTEINVYAEKEGKYRWIYNIVTHRLDEEEDYLVFKQLMLTLQAEFTGIDKTDGKGKGIYQRAAKEFPKENLVAVGFNEKLPTYPKKENGEYVYDKRGKLEYEEEYVIMWAYQRAQYLLYNQLMELPYNAKFDEQLDKVTLVQAKTRKTPQCLASEDHCWQAFEVFCIMHWLNELNLVKGVGPNKRCWIV